MTLVPTALLALTLGTIPAEAPADEPIPDCCAPKEDARADAELAWTDLLGREQKLGAFRGRFVVLNFWATWCLPCREELPELVEIQNRYGIYGVQVVGASADAADNKPSVVELAREYELNFPVLLGANTAQMKSLGLGEAIPATVVVDPEGKIVERFSGVLEVRELQRVLDDLVDRDEPVRRAALAHDHGHDHDDAHEHPGAGASLVPS